MKNYFNLTKIANRDGAWSMHSERPSWDYDEDRHGNVTIKAPDGRTCFLQGDDAQNLIRELEQAEKYFDNPKRYAWTIDTILGEYDHICE